MKFSATVSFSLRALLHGVFYIVRLSRELRKEYFFMLET
jgi:hypothetical protein